MHLQRPHSLIGRLVHFSLLPLFTLCLTFAVRNDRVLSAIKNLELLFLCFLPERSHFQSMFHVDKKVSVLAFNAAKMISPSWLADKLAGEFTSLSE